MTSTSTAFKCRWCDRGTKRPCRTPSDWEQRNGQGEWLTLGKACARKRLNNPYNALIPMRRIEPANG